MENTWTKSKVIVKDGIQIKVRYISKNTNCETWTLVDNGWKFGNAEWLKKLQSRYVSKKDRFCIL